MFGNRRREPSNSDLTSRLDAISEQVEEVRKRCQQEGGDIKADVEHLAYQVDYLIKVVRRHLSTGET